MVKGEGPAKDVEKRIAFVNVIRTLFLRCD